MGYRKGEDTFAIKKRRMPFVAKIRRDDPFRESDSREIDAMVRRIAAAGEHFSLAGWREDAGFRCFYFATWAKARALQHWIDRSGIANRPMPGAWIGPQLTVAGGAQVGTELAPNQKKPLEISRDGEGLVSP